MSVAFCGSRLLVRILRTGAEGHQQGRYARLSRLAAGQGHWSVREYLPGHGEKETAFSDTQNHTPIKHTRRRGKGSVQGAGIEFRRCPFYLDKVTQDRAHLGRVSDDGDELHLGATTGGRSTDRPRTPLRSAWPMLSGRRAAARFASWAVQRRRADAGHATLARPPERDVRHGASAATALCIERSTSRSNGCSERPMAG